MERRRRETRAIRFPGAHGPHDMLLLGVRGSGASPVSPRHVAGRLLERGVPVAPSTLKRWGITYSPQREDAVHRRQRPVGGSGRRDATSRRVPGAWQDWSRAVDTDGETLDVLRTEPRDQAAA